MFFVGVTGGKQENKLEKTAKFKWLKITPKMDRSELKTFPAWALMVATRIFGALMVSHSLPQVNFDRATRFSDEYQ